MTTIRYRLTAALTGLTGTGMVALTAALGIAARLGGA